MPTPKNRKLRDEENYKAYDVESAYKELCAFAKSNVGAIYLADLYHGIGMDKKTFQKLFPKNSDKRAKLLDMLDSNVDSQKAIIRNRLLEINQAAGLIALYKLLGTEEERISLSNVKIDKKSDGEKKDNNITLTIS